MAASLVAAESTAQHRVLVFRTCAKGHCFSDTYLQWLHGQPPQVIHTSRLSEFGEGVVVRSVRWLREERRPALLAIVDTRRKGAEPLTLLVVPGEPGVYRVERQRAAPEDASRRDRIRNFALLSIAGAEDPP